MGRREVQGRPKILVPGVDLGASLDQRSNSSRSVPVDCAVQRRAAVIVSDMNVDAGRNQHRRDTARRTMQWCQLAAEPMDVGG